jgi:hypothetical protein
MENDAITITKDHLDHIRPGDGSLASPALRYDVRNILLSSRGELRVEVAPGTPKFCLPECNLKSLKGSDASVAFTRLVVHELGIHALHGQYLPDLGGARLTSTALTVHTGRVNHVVVNDLHLTGGQLEVAVSGTVTHVQGNGKLIGPKIAYPPNPHWGRGLLILTEKDPNIEVYCNVKVSTKGQRKIRDFATSLGSAALKKAKQVLRRTGQH